MEVSIFETTDFTPNFIKKILFIWTPRAGCSSMVQACFDSLGILDVALKYDPFVHIYRNFIFDVKRKKKFEYYIKNNYYMIKLVRNPYDRLVSSYILLLNKKNTDLIGNNIEEINISFREFIQMIYDKKYNIFSKKNICYPYHIQLQYKQYEDSYINKIIKCENLETVYGINFSKYKNAHYTEKKEITDKKYCDIKLLDITEIPNNYNLFYDEELKKIVYEIYKKDFIKYNYSF